MTTSSYPFLMASFFANVDIWYDPDDLAATGETSGPGFFHLARVGF